MILHSYRKKTFSTSPNWVNYPIGEDMVFSHRITEYNASTFPESLHFHDYYELVIYMSGQIRYICENKTLLPEPGDIILAAPLMMHTSTLSKQSRYDRYVFYLYATAFDAFGGGPLTGFLQSAGGPYIYLKAARRPELFALLGQAEQALKEGGAGSGAVALSYVVQLFALINSHAADSTKKDPHFPKSVLEIKRYIDEHFMQIQSVSQVAEHFFYSREYVSRLFKRYLNTSVNDYLQKRRITWCRQQLETALPINDICYQAGFRNMSSFIRTFSALTGMPPSRYRLSLRESGEKRG